MITGFFMKTLALVMSLFIFMPFGATPEAIEKLLGKPTKKYSHGQVKSHNPDSFTFFRYELLTTISPKPFYCVTIMFSKNKGKILSVYSDTNLSQFSSKKKGNGAIP